MLVDWKVRYRLTFDVVYVPWPIDVARHRYRRRDRCRSFLYVNGWGGCQARRLDDTLTDYRRKGLDTIIGAAVRAPELEFVVHSQRPITDPLPKNIRPLGRQADNRSLYLVGDVCVQPSHWEGIGLQLLECQAAGLPLVTTDAPPMNAYQPLATLPVVGRELLRLSSQPFLSNIMDPADVVHVLRDIHGQSIVDASIKARQFVETHHSWAVGGPAMVAALETFRSERHTHASTDQEEDRDESEYSRVPVSRSVAKR
jgi:glycosyltransferase involved in cell wall biosynthesis